MKDTIQTIIKNVESSSLDGIELINKVDSFYNSAWDKLIIVGSIAFGVIGLLVPFVIQWYQKKSLKISEDLLKSEIENQTLKLKSELLEDINKTLEEKIEVFETKLEKMHAASNAAAHHLQGNTRARSGDFLGALVDYIDCAGNYIICEDYVNLRSILETILNHCLPKLSLEEINDIKISHDSDLELLLDDLKDKDENGSFTWTIREIKLKLSKLPSAKNNKPTPLE